MVVGFSGSDDLMFTLVPIFVMVMFVVVFGFFIVGAITGVKTWNRNNNSPILTVNATVVTKRTEVSQHMNHQADNMDMHHSTTTYYATFEVESGDRIELQISGSDYGMLAEGDIGRVTFQGTRYKGFERVQ